MGEHEQGGMLTNVVVMGMVGLVVAAFFVVILNLKTNVNNTVQQTADAQRDAPRLVKHTIE